MKTETDLNQEDELEEVDRRILKLAKEMSAEEFKLLQLWYFQDISGFDLTIFDINKVDETLLYVEGYDFEDNSTLLLAIQTNPDISDIEYIYDFMDENPGYNEYNYFPFGNDAVKCKLVTWLFHVANRLDFEHKFEVHPKLKNIKNKVMETLTGFLIPQFHIAFGIPLEEDDDIYDNLDYDDIYNNPNYDDDSENDNTNYDNYDDWDDYDDFDDYE